MEEDDIKLDVVDDRESGPGAVNYDDEFADECGYSLIKALRGSSTGRQLKRAIFKVGCYQLLYSVPIVLGVIHQFGGVILFLSSLWLLHFQKGKYSSN